MSGADASARYVRALALGLDPAWRRLDAAQRRSTADAFVKALAPGLGVVTETYSLIGLKPGIDLLVWQLAGSVDALEEESARLLRSGLGRWLAVRESFTGLISDSQYVVRPTTQEQTLFEGDRARYLIVYPFTKTTEWYLTSREVRQGSMNEHMRVGHTYPQVRQLLAYSFGPRRPGLPGRLRDGRAAGVLGARARPARDREPPVHAPRHPDPPRDPPAGGRDRGAPWRLR